jgi:hypothetical protein
MVISWFIVTAVARAEKGTMPESWNSILTAHRLRFDRFESQSETYQFDIQDTTHLVSFSQGEEYLTRVGEWISTASGESLLSTEVVTHLSALSQEVFGFEASVSETLSQIHQRDREQGYYRVWDRLTGALAVFDRNGVWQQDRGEISLGPPVSEGEIEVYLAGMGLLVPSISVAETIPPATQEQGSEAYLVHMADLEGVRFRFGSRPWTDSGRVLLTEEFPYWEEIEQGLWEKRQWYEFPQGIGDASFEGLPALGIELRYDMNSNISGFSIIRVLSFVFDPNQWSAFPRERPPLGWNVLDYRFMPETEYQFGSYP